MTPSRPLRFGEFIALLALLMATVAYSVDAMLPLLGLIGAELSPAAPEQAQLVLTVFLLGLGLGTFIAGPLSDALGRKTVILAGIALYMTAATVAALSPTMTVLLAARFVQGMGASAPRVVSQALVRDLYAGRMMARVISFSMTVFTLVPAIAPLLGAGLGHLFGWRAIFWSFLVFGTISALWLITRQPETLPAERRRRMDARALLAALREVVGHPRVRLYLAAQTFVYAAMFIWLSEVALIFAEFFGRASEFPRWFALVALLSAPSSLLNARLVMRLGMRRMIGIAITGQMVLSVVAIGVFLGTYGATASGVWGFAFFILYMLAQFFATGFLIGNLNALALEPMGHVAGMAASVMGGVSTIAAALVAIPMSYVHNGTPLPLAVAALIASSLCAACMIRARRYQLGAASG